MGSRPQYHPPAAPDPNMVAAAQGKQERLAARQNALFLNPSVRSPFGNVNYDVNEENIEGENVKRPTQTIELSPAQEAEMGRQEQMREGIHGAGMPMVGHLQEGVNQIQGLGRERPNLHGVEKVGSINDYENQRGQIEKAHFDRAMRLLRPDLEQQENSLKHHLSAYGHPMGNESYSKEMNRFETNRGEMMKDLAERAMLAGGQEQNRLFGLGQQIRGEQFNEGMRPYLVNQQERQGQMAENQQNLALLHALLQGHQIQLPQMQQYNQAAMRAPDIQGMYASNHAQNSQNYNTGYQGDLSGYLSNLKGMYGLAGKAMGMGGNMLGQHMYG